MPASPSSLRITLVKSPIGYTVRQKATVRALGLRRLRQVVVRPDNEAIRGMIFKIQHLVRVEPASEDDGRPTTDARTRQPSSVVHPRSSERDGDETASRPATRATATSRRRSSGGDVDETA